MVGHPFLEIYLTSYFSDRLSIPFNWQVPHRAAFHLYSSTFPFVVLKKKAVNWTVWVVSIRFEAVKTLIKRHAFV